MDGSPAAVAGKKVLLFLLNSQEVPIQAVYIYHAQRLVVLEMSGPTRRVGKGLPLTEGRGLDRGERGRKRLVTELYIVLKVNNKEE